MPSPSPARRLAHVAVAAALLALGFGVGWWARGPDETPAPPAAEPTRSPAAAETSPAPTPLPPVTDEPSPFSLDAEAIDALRRDVEALRTSAPRIRRAWPQQPGRDSADEWPERMETLFSDCGGGLELVDTRCDEFPCVATVRTDEPPRDEIVKLTDLFGPDCAALAADMPDAEHALIVTFDVDCPDGATETMMVFATGDAAPLQEAYPEGDDQILTRLMLDLSRRSEALAAEWPCGD
ncbi:MAG: hypothetical protein KDA24_06285 [Deltaproteobacteria bacterium]|nr:hypothetical protein [Deltaproteobacteria bacterium]